jgi:hypothetical protein
MSAIEIILWFLFVLHIVVAFIVDSTISEQTRWRMHIFFMLILVCLTLLEIFR